MLFLLSHQDEQSLETPKPLFKATQHAPYFKSLLHKQFAVPKRSKTEYQYSDDELFYQYIHGQCITISAKRFSMATDRYPIIFSIRNLL